MRRLPRSLQGRLLAMVLGLVVAVWLATATMTWIDARHELDELLDGHLAQAAALLVVQQAAPAEEDDGIDAPVLHRYAPKVAFQVFHEGRLVQRSANAPVEPMMAGPAPGADAFGDAAIAGTTWRVFATHGAERDVQVFVGEQVDSRDSILWAVLRSMLAPMLVALPLLAAAAWWAVRQGVAPIRRLGRTLADRRPQDLEPVHVEGAPSEMTPMLAALNGLFVRIAGLIETERRFTADAAHELRTPIAAIRAQAQVALGATDPRERDHALAATLLGCDRAARLVAQMLTLSRLESGGAPVLGRVDFDAVLGREVAERVPAALDKGQDIALESAPGCVVRGDPSLLAVLARNLVDNAIRYSPPGATIRVTLAPAAGGARLGIEDSGPGMSDADMRRLGERFFRVIGSAAEGSGLGWSIVRRIAAVHDATVAIARSASLGGLAVTVAFPDPAIVDAHAGPARAAA